MSAGDACADAAFSAGCGSSSAIAASQPGSETPSMPTRPLLFGTFFSSQSIVSYASVLSSIAERSLSIARRALHDERAFRLEAAADVLEDEDVAVLIQEFIAARGGALVSRHAVRSAHEEEGQRRGTAFRDEDDGMESHAVAHRDHVLGYVEEVGGARREARPQHPDNESRPGPFLGHVVQRISTSRILPGHEISRPAPADPRLVSYWTGAGI